MQAADGIYKVIVDVVEVSQDPTMTHPFYIVRMIFE